MADDLQLALRDGADRPVWIRIERTLEAFDRYLTGLSDAEPSSRSHARHRLIGWARTLPAELGGRILAMLRPAATVNIRPSSGAAVGLAAVVMRPDADTFQVLTTGTLDPALSRARVQAEVVLYDDLWHRFEKPGAEHLHRLRVLVEEQDAVESGVLRFEILDHARRLFVAGGGDLDLLRIQVEIAEQIAFDQMSEDLRD